MHSAPTPVGGRSVTALLLSLFRVCLFCVPTPFENEPILIHHISCVASVVVRTCGGGKCNFIMANQMLPATSIYKALIGTSEI